MSHKYDEYIELITSSRNIDQPFYMLVDCMAGIASAESTSVVSMRKRFGEDKVVVVPRPNYMDAPDDCPYLVELAAAGEEISEDVLAEILPYSVVMTRGLNPGAQRYFCGWLQSATGIKALADGLAQRMVFSFQGQNRVFPIHEPLYQEIIAYTAPAEQHSHWLGDISQWIIPTSWQTYIRLEGTPAGQEEAPFGIDTLNAMADMRYIRNSLAVWYKQTNEELPPERLQMQPLLGRGLYSLPDAAAYRILEQLHHAQRAGIRDETDYTVYALMHLTVHPDFGTHPYVVDALEKARAGQSTFTDALSPMDYPHWMRMLQDLRNNQARAY